MALATMVTVTDTTDIATNSNGERLPPPAPTSPNTCDPTNTFPRWKPDTRTEWFAMKY
jgi:hypothetical protein